MSILRKIALFVAVPVILLLAVPIALAAIPVAFVTSVFFPYRGRETPGELAALLRRIGDDSIDRGEWDEFECLHLRAEQLEEIRRRAFPCCGRPGEVNRQALYALAVEAEKLA